MLLGVSALGASAQDSSVTTPSIDTTAHDLPAVVVTADRLPGIMGTQTAMVNRLPAELLRRQPIQRLSDGLQSVPGLIVLNAGAMGEQPRLLMRGFYGGGETEYAAVLLDGVPLGTLSSGVVNWDLVPLSAVHAVEVVRGSSSALYGDAAVGGVINIQTLAATQTPLRWQLAAGGYGTVDGNAAWTGSLGSRRSSVFGGKRKSDGYRAHERRDALTLGGTIDLYRSTHRSLALSTLYHERDYDDPGPLHEGLIGTAPRTSLPFFRFDHGAETLRRVSISGFATLGAASRLSGYLTGEGASADLTRTLQLAPDFADTRARATDARRLLGSIQLESGWTRGPWPQRLVFGTDLSFGRLDSEYRPLLMGGAGEYGTPNAVAGDVEADGRGTREAAALFGHWEHRIAPPLRVVLGARMDWLSDDYHPALPADLARMTVVHRAFSPRAGINFQYLETSAQTGHVYTSISRSFKAPTLDQLFDQRPIPIPVEPYSVTVSNPDLRPQRGSAIEAGMIHRASLSRGRALEISLAAYRQEMRDELDFDIASFRYINVGRSLHRGVELGTRLETAGGANMFASLTRQNALALHGPNARRHLKAVPRQALSAGVAGELPLRLQGGLSVSDVRGAFLDDANTRRLPGNTRIDVRFATRTALRFSLDVLNLLDRRSVSTGFPDPSGTGVAYYHPAAGRVLLFGLSSAW
jgi:outer membrane receptor protein involved in Fe transport